MMLFPLLTMIYSQCSYLTST